MDYENREIPEGINVSDEHPLKEFTSLLLGVGALAVVIIFVLASITQWLARYVPFETEVRLANNQFFSSAAPVLDEAGREKQRYLQALADRLAEAQGLPPGMTIKVHYSQKETVNAFATLGGNVVMFRGLLDKLPHENALAMVMAHEIAHVKHRDPIVSLGRGVTIGLVLASLAGAGDSAMAQQVLGKIGLLTTMGFSRRQEEAADAEALRTVLKHYGHVDGTAALFRVFKESAEKEGRGHVPEFLSSHPLTDDRTDAIVAFKKEHPGDGPLVPLP